MDKMQYRISDLAQLAGCKSNTSRDLSLRVNHFVAGSILGGAQICVNHSELGTLAAFLVNPEGGIIDNATAAMSVSDILQHLTLFGFYIEYKPDAELPEEVADMLYGVSCLGMRMVRNLMVRDADDSTKLTAYTVAFDAGRVSNWIEPNYAAPHSEFANAVLTGAAIIIDNAQNPAYDWSWLNGVGNIENILQANGWVINNE